MGDERSHDTAPAIALPAGVKIGELIVLRTIGEGGMGVVLAAYDPDLDRRVAVKLLRAADVADPETARARMRREAQAMAKLSHPNVLSVYEVGTHEGEVYVVMELVDGPTLGGWLADRKRGWQEIVACLVEAGRGLAAAHAVNLVHRDFKPDNVLIGADGRPRVADFGIASIGGDPVPIDRAVLDEIERHVVALRSETSSANQTDLTRTGMMVGTPAYMAPEQFAARPVDARADQFAFCVVLWEALYDERPFGASVIEVLTGAKVAALPRKRNDAVPRRVRDALEKGLSLDPAARHPSMDALLDELAPRATRGRWLPLAALLAMLSLVVGVSAAMLRSSDPCPEPSLAGTWDEGLRAEVRARFRATGLDFAEASLEATLRGLDAYAQEWTTEHVAACRATAVEHTQSDNLLDLRIQCLDRRRADLEAFARALSAADAQAVERSLDGVSNLPAIEVCRDTEALLGSTPLPQDPSRRAAIALVRQELSVARAALATGHGAEGMEVVGGLTQRVEDLEFAPLAAEALLLQAALEAETGEMERSLAVYDAAMRAAAEAHMDGLLLDAAARRAGIQILQFDRVDAVMAQRELLEALAARSNDPVLGAYAHSRIAIAVDRSGDSEGAAEIQASVVEQLTAHLGENDRRTAGAINNLGAFRKNTGDLEGSLRDYGRALSLLEDLLGRSHPGLIFSLSGLGTTHSLLGEFEQAHAELLRALTIIEQSLGPEHPEAGDVCWYVAINLVRKGDHDEAVRYAERSAEILHDYGGSRLAWPLRVGARAHAAGGDPSRALEMLQEAVALQLTQHDTDHPEVAKARQELADVYLALGDTDAARAALDQALPVLETSRMEPRWLYDALLTEAEYFRRNGDFEHARANVARVLGEAPSRLGERHLVVVAANEANDRMGGAAD